MELPEKEILTDMILEKLDKLGKTQVDLADEIEIDETTLNRHLNNEITTSYEQMKEVWRSIQDWEKEQRQPATELMTEGFTSTTLTETRRKAVDKMQGGNFSQLPVREREEGEVVGIVTDTDLMAVHEDEKPIKEIEFHHVIEVTKDTDRRLIEKILEEGHPAVLVVDGGTPVGIITRADLLETASPS